MSLMNVSPETVDPILYGLSGMIAGVSSGNMKWAIAVEIEKAKMNQATNPAIGNRKKRPRAVREYKYWRRDCKDQQESFFR